MSTRTQLRTEIRRLLNDTSSTKFSDSQLNDWLDLANSFVITDLGPFDTAMATISTVQDEPNYQLPTNCIGVKEVYLDDEAGNETRIYCFTQAEMTERHGVQWRENPSGQPRDAYFSDYNLLGLEPKPNAANASKTLRVFYYRTPSAFASDSDTPIFMAAIQDSLTWYCVSRGYAQLGKITESDWALKRAVDLVKKFKSLSNKQSDDFEGWRWNGADF